MKAAEARVLLTGASGGIGSEAAAALLRAGAQVMLAGRSSAKLDALVARLAGSAPPDRRVATVVADLDVPGDVARLAEAAAGWGCNVLVHAAGAPSFGPLVAQAPQAIEQVLRTNLLGPIVLTQALLPHLLRQPRAQVLCVGSVLGRIGLPGYSVYGASKFGLRGFAEALRRELAGTSVKVQYLGPRSTRTAFNSEAVEAYNRATGTAMDTPAAVAAALLRLLEDESAERFLGWPEQLGIRINGLAPGLLDGAFERHSRSVASLVPPIERTSP